MLKGIQINTTTNIRMNLTLNMLMLKHKMLTIELMK
jgi:hypothetical protein